MSNIKNSLAWSFFERYMSQIVTLVSSMILARLLTPEQIGIYSLCAALTALATIFRDFGVSEYIIQEKNLSKDKLAGAYALAIITAWLMAIVLYLVREPISSFYNEPGVKDIIEVLCLTFFILPFASPAFALLNRQMEFRKIFLVQFPSTLVQAVTGVVLAYQGFTYMSLAWASLANIVCQTLIITLMRPKDSFIFPSPKQALTVLKFGMMFSSSRTLEVVRNNSHEFIIGHFLGFTVLGLFSRASGLISLFYTNVTTAAVRVAAPSFAAADRVSREQLLKNYVSALSFFLIFAWPFFVFVSLEAESVILLLFGQQWVEAAPIASLLATAALFSSVTAFAPNILIAMGMVKRRLQIVLLVAPVHIIGIYIAAHFNSLTVASVWIFTSAFTLFIYNIHLTSAVGLSLKVIFSGIGVNIKITLLNILPVALIKLLIWHFDMHSLWFFFLNCLVYTLTWLFLINYYKHPIADEINNILQKLMSKMRSNGQS